jgi:hypothetical protein
MRFLVLVAACAGARRLDIVGDGTFQYASQGACYDPTTQITVCFRPGATSSNPSLTQTECEAVGNTWYAKGHIGSDGCCLCDSNCDHSLETAAAGTCNYPDRNAGSCQNAATGQVTCDVTAGQCASPNVWSEAGALDSDGCCFCDETCDHSAETGTDCYLKDYADESQSDGSCYDPTTHQVTCDVGHAACDARGAFWYSPGFINSRTGCCHCDASCDHSLETGTDCSSNYFGGDGYAGSGGGHGAEYSYGAWQTLAGYQTATDVEPYSKIDLDMEEFETAVGEYAANANWIDDAMVIYKNGGNSVKDSGAYRTLEGFATSGEAKMMGWTTYPIYYAYWNDYNYADTFITKDYSATVKDNGRAELMKKGANYQAVWMYVLHKLEDTVAECYSGDEDASNEWDEGWAIYAGSMVAATAADAARSSTASQEGTLIWELAEKRGSDFGTLDSTGPATVNVNLLAKFIMGRDLIIDAKCAEAESLVDPIRAQMTVPLVQGTLKYAYKADPANAGGSCVADAGKNAMTASDGCVKSWAEAWAFAAAVLPQVHQCDAAAAATIRDNVDITAAEPMKNGFAAVKAALESTYTCLGITCTDVGAYSDTTACEDHTTPIWVWQTLAGYQTATDVGPHAKIDLDMEELEIKVGEYDINPNWITEAMFIYENGGNGLCQQTDVDAAMAGTATPWCTDTTKALGNSQKSTKVRTLRGFATKDYSTDKLTGADGGNYGEQMPPIYAGYWNDWAWADTFITKDYSAIAKPSGWNQLMKKGANYQAVWMYVLHELEDAIGDCYDGDIYANDGTPTGGAPHAWDEGWAFYAGSLVAETAHDAVTSRGVLIWELAEKKGIEFGTGHYTGPATVNVKLLAEFIEGRDLIIAGKCAEAESLVEPIRAQMTVPLVQGTLKYAYNSDPKTTTGYCTADAAKTALTASDGCVKSWAEAWAFAAAVLPQVAECDWGAAETIRYNLDIEAAAPVQGGFYSVKSAIESTYRCLGITCADVGAYPGTMPCSEPDDDDDDDDDDDLLDGGLREVMSLAPMGLAAIGITFTGITIATLVNLAQEQCALGPTIIFEAGTTHPYYITPNLCTIGAHTYSSKKTVRDASPRKVCRKFCEAASASGKLALKQVHGLTCYCKRK